MFKNILVPTDFSEDDIHALEIAVRLSSLGHGKIRLLHVIEIIANTSFEEFRDFYTTLEKRAYDDMTAMIGRFQDDAERIEPEVIYGSRAREILRFAEDSSTDLIVMKSHRIDVEDRAQGWGTISYKVGILAQCPVMLVK